MKNRGIGPETDKYLSEAVLYEQDWTDPLEEWLDRVDPREEEE